MNDRYRLPNLDLRFATNWSPARMAFIGVLIYALLIIISPLEYDYSVITLDAAAYALLCFLSFFGGCHVVEVLARSKGPVTPAQVAVEPDRFINVTLALGAIGIVARVYDRFVLRNFAVGDSFMATRESLVETVSVFGYIGAVFFSFGMIALMLIWLSDSQRRRPIVFVCAVAMTLYPALESLLQGSRSTLLHVAFLTFFLARSTNSLRWLVRSPWALLATGIALATFSELVYELRSLQGDDEQEIADIFKLTAIGQFARPPQWITEAIIANNGSGLVGGTLKVLTHSLQYLTHSWVVYFVNFEGFDGVLGYGRFHLYLPTRLLSVALGEDFNYDPTLYGMVPGVSATAFSLVYYDFGALGPLLAGAFGAVATLVHKRALRYPERWLPLNAYLVFASLAMTVDNQLVGSLGAYAIWTFIAYVPLHALMTGLSQRASQAVASGERPQIAQATP
jgi:hypothetical protein